MTVDIRQTKFPNLNDNKCLYFVFFVIVLTLMASKRMASSLIKLIQNGQIHDNVGKSILSISFNSHVAEVEYERDGDVYDLVHTTIPDEVQGQGLGSVFAEKVFDYLVEKDKKFKLTCEFLEHFYSKNEDKYKEFVVED